MVVFQLNSSDKKKPVISGVLLAAALGVNVFLFTPALIYFANGNEFVTPIAQLFGGWAIPAIATLLLVMVIGLALPTRWYRPYLVMVANLNLLVWLQGNVLVWDYGLLDGRLIDWSVNAWRGWVDGLVWVVVIAVGFVFSRTLCRPVSQAVGVLFFIQLLLVGWAGFKHSQKPVLAVKLSQEKALKSLAGFSEGRDVIHIVLDAFQSDFFDELVHHPQIGLAYRDSLSGFTFYRETLGVFPFTRFAVPAFLSGKIYTNERPKDEFIQGSISENSILSVAAAAGMELDLASVEYWAPLYASAGYANSYVIPENGHGSDSEFRAANMAKLVDLALFRVAPHFLKRKIYDGQRWLITPLVMDVDYLQFHYFAHTQFINQLIDKMGVNRKAPTYKYFHVMNTHDPMVVNLDCSYAGRVLPLNRTTLLMQSKCTLDTVVQLLSKLKRLGVYDRSLIILHADHGGWVPRRDYQPEKVNLHHEVPAWAISLSSPLLAIKPPGVGGELVASNKLASLGDIADTVADIMDWPQQFGGTSLLKVGEDEPRTRYFYHHYWREDSWEIDYAGPIQEFEIRGKHYESAWIPHRVFKHKDYGFW